VADMINSIFIAEETENFNIPKMVRRKKEQKIKVFRLREENRVIFKYGR
jgi:hypothetical protein